MTYLQSYGIPPVGLPSVAVVILSYNNVADTCECLESVFQLDYPNWRTLLVDNGSTDGTSEIVRERFPPVTVIRTEDNQGVPGGFNLGIKAAMREGADFILLLNNDTIVAATILRELVAVARTDSSVGIVMPRILYYDDRDRVWSAGARYRRFPPAIVFIGLGQPAEQHERPRDLDFAPSCCLLISRATFERVGRLDSGYRFYYDDYDFCIRARAAGLRIAYAPAARMWHKVSRTIRKRPAEFWRTWGMSAARFYRRHGHPWYLSLPVHVGYIAGRELVKGEGRRLPYFFAGLATGLRQPLEPLPTAAGQGSLRES